MKRLFLILLSISLFNITSVNAQGFLKASGKAIINSSTGQEVYLKGIGLGGWLVQEGYMFNTSGFANADWEIRNSITSLLGQAYADSFYQAFYKNFITKKDIDQLAKWGFNSVRLPLHYKLLMKVNTDGTWTYLNEGFKTIDSVLSWCEQNKIYLILDLHAAPGAQSPDNISDSDGEARLWTEPNKYQPMTVDLWKVLAHRYANKEWIGGYDLINETVNRGSNAAAALRTLFINITNAVRQEDKNHIIFIEGNYYANDFSGLTPPWDNNMAYSFHKYWNQTDQGSIQWVLNIRNNYNVPLWLGETGENSDQWFVETVELLKKNNIGWSWWTIKKFGSVSSLLSVPVTADYQKLLDYWSGSGPKPSVSFAYNALITMANNLKIENCTENKSVIDALFRQPENTATVPYSENKIPGIIYGVNYDLGKVNSAYFDNDYKNTGGSGGSAYNSGWVYRNDGVDIQRCSDSRTNGYNIFGINPGEWVRFTIDAERSDSFDIKLRVASGSSGGKISLRLDGTPIANSLTVPPTGGNQSWQTIDAGKFSISKGTHVFTVVFTSGSYSFNYAEFTGNNVAQPEGYKLYQNHPNPFNPGTKIKYFIPEQTHVTLKLYNILGSEIATLIDEEKEPDEYEVSFNASEYNLCSGTYFYRLKAGDFSETKKLVYVK